MRSFKSWLPALLAMAVLTVGLIATGLSAKAINDSIDAQAKLQFNKELDSVKLAMQTHLEQLVTLMQAVRAGFASSVEVTSDEFNLLTEALEMRSRYPSVASMSYIERVPARDLQMFIAARQEEGPRYRFRYSKEPAAHAREFDHFVVKYGEPATARVNVGLEVSTDIDKLSAMERAARAGTAVLTPPIRLELDAEKSTAFGFFLPVYLSGMVPNDHADRARLLNGYVSIGFNIHSFIDVALRGHPLTIDFELTDPLATSPDGQGLGLLLYDRDGHRGGKPDAAAQAGKRLIEHDGQYFLGNRYFDLHASTTPAFEAQFSRQTTWFLAVAGLLTSISMAWGAFVLARSDRQARRQVAELGADNERLASVVKNTANLVIITGEDGLISWVNPAFERVTGYTLAEVANRNPGRLLQCDDTDPATVRLLSRAIRAQEPVEAEILNQTKDGKQYWINLVIQPLWTTQGTLKGYMAIEQDVTQRKLAQQGMEAALRETAALMATINLYAIVSQTDARGVITHANAAFSDISGYATSELIGRSHNVVNSGQHPPEFWQHMWATIRPGKPWHGEVCNRAKSGDLYWVDTLVAPFVDETGRIDRFVSISTDVTARMRVQHALQKAQRDLELSNKAARIGTWELDIERDVMTWSTVTRSIFNTPDGFAITRRTALRFIPEGPVRDASRLAMRLALGSGTGWDVEQPLVTYTGETLWVRSIGVTEMVDGRCVRVYGTFQDVHDRKRRELEMERGRQKLQSTIDGTGAATWEWNVQTGETVFNTLWASMLGYTLDELQPTTIDTWSRFCHPDDLLQAQAALEWYFSGVSEGYESVFRMRHRDGHWLWVRDTGRVVSHTPDGKPLLMYGTHIDITAFKQAQLEAEAHSSRLKNIIEGTRAGTWEWNLQTGQATFNDLFAEMLGYRADELGAHAWELLAKTTHPDDFARSQHALARHWKGEIPYHDFTVRALHKDGHVVWVQDRGRVVERDEKGRAVLMTGTRLDVTELVRAREEATEKEHLLTSALESVGAALAVFDASERLVLANDRFFNMHQPLARVLRIGITFEEFITAGLDAGAMRPDGGDRSTWLRDRLAGFRAGTTDRVIPLQDGTALRVVERRTPEGMTVGLRFDVSELENARRAAQQALVRQQAIFEVLPVGITITDPAGHIVDCNPASERLLGITKAEHLARRYDSQEWIILREDGSVMPTEEYASVRALRDRHAIRDQVMHVRTAEQEVVLSVSAVPVDDADLGVVVGYVDITDLARARAEAEAASRSKSQFVANMSHEIRTPMNAILGMLHLLQTTPLSARQKDYAEKSESAAKSLLGILNDILDFSKVEAGKMELDPEPFSFDKLVRDLAVIYSSNAKAKQLELLFDIDSRIPNVVIGDSLRLQQVLINLGGNAIKFTAQGEVMLRVHLDARREQDGHDVVDLLFEVHDSGIGIPPESQAKIFSGFTQAESSTSRKYGGTGLGLAISQRLVRLMGGELQLSSAVGEGSTFYFRIPMRVPADVPADFAPKDRSALANLKALVVDDNLVAQQIMTGMLQSLGWDAYAAESPEDALTLFDPSATDGPQRFDVIFLDWDMPGMDGLTLAAELAKRFGDGPRPIMIMVTASGRDVLHAAPDDQQKVLDGFLVKPVTGSMLYDAVADALAVASGAAPVVDVQRARTRTLNGMRLLVVEDNLINQQVAQELLMREGARVQLAQHGQEAVDMLRASPEAYDLVLMDMQMPVLDGLQATHAIRNRLHLRELPIVAMTANAMASDREACLAAGMNDHVGKPFELQHLVRTLLRWAGQAVKPCDTTTDTDVALADQAVDEPVRIINTIAPKSIAESDEGQKTVKIDDWHAPWPDGGRVEVSAALQRLGGDPAFYQRIVRNFCTDLGTQPARLRSLVPGATANELAATLHTLKGTSSTVGAYKLAELAAAAERAVKDQVAANLPATTEWLAGLCDEVAASEAALARVLQAMQQRLGMGATAPAAADAGASADWRGQWLSRLQQLASLLADSDMQALELHDEMLQDGGLAAHPSWQPLHAAMEMMDFDQALAAANTLLADTPNP